MLREGTWLVRHACSNTQIGAQHAGLVLVARTSTRLPSTAQKVAAIGRPSALSSLAEQEDAVLDIIDGIHNSFRPSLSAPSSRRARSYQKFTDRYPSRNERQSPLHQKTNHPKKTPNPGTVDTQSSIPPSVPAVGTEDHRECRPRILLISK
jgi:hypothetical protein